MKVSLKSILSAAKAGRYAVGAFNCLSIEHARGVIKAAEEHNSPVILQIAEVQFPYAPMELMAPVFLRLAESASVPVCVHLDHGLSYETCARAVQLGFSSVMIDSSCLPFEENIEEARKVVRMASGAGVDVEAELGHVGDAGTADEGHISEDVFTRVQDAVEYIDRTGIDALAIAIGNLHGKYIATPELNIGRLKEISAVTSCPLVLHGGSGTSEEDFKACVHNGICKINVATSLQIAVTDAVTKYLKDSPNPNYIDMKGIIEEATARAAFYHMDLFESVGKA